jgi:hypothetical protein
MSTILRRVLIAPKAGDYGAAAAKAAQEVPIRISRRVII